MRIKKNIISWSWTWQIWVETFFLRDKLSFVRVKISYSFQVWEVDFSNKDDQFSVLLWKSILVPANFQQKWDRCQIIETGDKNRYFEVYLPENADWEKIYVKM